MFDSVIRFNAAYIEATPKARIDAILEGLRLLAPTGLPVFTLAVWAMASLRLVSTSGRSLNHYFMAWLPISAVLAARFFRQLMGPSDESELRLGAGIRPRTAWTIGLAVVILLLPLRRLLPPFFNFLAD